jgi:KDO2-lipid IV(A) lauroyltransferase
MAALAWLAARVPGTHRRIARANLQAALPAMDPGRIEAAMYRHLSLSLLEALHLRTDLVDLPVETRQVLAAALAQGRGAVVATGHIGNWELFAQRMAREFPVTVVAKNTYDPRLTALVHRFRTQLGMEVLWRGDALLRDQIAAALLRGRVLALLIDQRTKVPSVDVPFFGRPAPTPAAAALLALKHQTPLLVGWSQRQDDGRHVVHLEDVRAQGDVDVPALTAVLTARLEAAIVVRPEQWVWLHERWRGLTSEQYRYRPATQKRGTMAVANAREIFEAALPARLKDNPDLVSSVAAAYKFVVSGDGGGTWIVDLSQPGGRITEGDAEAGCTISIADADLVSVVNGQLNAQMAFMSGKLKVAGDMGLAMKLTTLFG